MGTTELHVGLYFGTFNPIHNGHILLSNYLIDNGYMNELWLVVSPQSPFKREMVLLPETDRLALAQTAVKEYRNIKICDAEMTLPKPSYTIDTLRYLSQKHPDYRFTLVMGADNVEGFSRWKCSYEIERNYRLLIYPREGYESIVLSPSMRLLADVPLYPFSSTEIRRKIARGEDISAEVPPAIREKCIELYRNNNK